MGLVNNIPISVKEEAFCDVAPVKKRIKKVLVGVGNGYSTENRDMRFIKIFFGNNPNQTTKTLSYTKPLNTKDIKKVLETLKNIIKKDNYDVEKALEAETDGISLKDRKFFRENITKIKAA